MPFVEHENWISNLLIILFFLCNENKIGICVVLDLCSSQQYKQLSMLLNKLGFYLINQSDRRQSEIIRQSHILNYSVYALGVPARKDFLLDKI